MTLFSSTRPAGPRSLLFSGALLLMGAGACDDRDETSLTQASDLAQNGSLGGAGTAQAGGAGEAGSAGASESGAGGAGLVDCSTQDPHANSGFGGSHIGSLWCCVERAPLVAGSGFYAFDGLPVHGHWKDNDMISDCYTGDEDTTIVDGAFSLHLKQFSHLVIYTLIDSANFKLYLDYDNGAPAFLTFFPADARLSLGALAVTLDLKPAADGAALCSCLKGLCESPDCSHHTLALPGKLDFPSRFVAWSDTNGNHKQDSDEPAIEDSIVGKHCTLDGSPLSSDMVVNLRCSVDFDSLTP